MTHPPTSIVISDFWISFFLCRAHKLALHPQWCWRSAGYVCHCSLRRVYYPSWYISGHVLSRFWLGAVTLDHTVFYLFRACRASWTSLYRVLHYITLRIYLVMSQVHLPNTATIACHSHDTIGLLGYSLYIRKQARYCCASDTRAFAWKFEHGHIETCSCHWVVFDLLYNATVLQRFLGNFAESEHGSGFF